jgi:hypothetical protein
MQPSWRTGPQALRRLLAPRRDQAPLPGDQCRLTPLACGDSVSAVRLIVMTTS